MEMTEPTRAMVEDMSRSEALDRLQRHGFVGRVAFIVDGRPMIMPVNYLADSDALVFCTGEGTKLSASAAAHPLPSRSTTAAPSTTADGASSSRARRPRSPIRRS